MLKNVLLPRTCNKNILCVKKFQKNNSQSLCLSVFTPKTVDDIVILSNCFSIITVQGSDTIWCPIPWAQRKNAPS